MIASTPRVWRLIRCGLMRISFIIACGPCVLTSMLYDQRKKMFSRTPAHDVHSHFADAFGLACQTFKMAKPNAVLQQRDRSWIV